MRLGWPKHPDDLIPYLEWVSEGCQDNERFEKMWKDGLLRYIQGHGHIRWKGEGQSPLAGLAAAKDEDGTFRTRAFLRYFTGTESLPPPGQQIVVCPIFARP